MKDIYYCFDENATLTQILKDANNWNSFRAHNYAITTCEMCATQDTKCRLWNGQFYCEACRDAKIAREVG